LLEKWTWEDKNLSKITAGDNSYYWNFQYNDKDQIEKITHSDGDYYTFSYDNKSIKEITFYTSGNVVVEKYEFEHTKKKITKVTNTFYGYKSLSITNQNKTTALGCFLPEIVVNSLFSEHKNHIPIIKSMKFIDVYEYTWDGDNIKKTVYKGGAFDEYDAYTLECTYKYDKKNNPFYYALIPNDITMSPTYTDIYTWNILHSKNNVINEEGFDSESMSFERKYDIQYDKKFPIEIKRTTEYTGIDSLYTGTYFYTYI
jgi:hypothetical protein